MIDDEFEWDDAKAAANADKHGVTFEMARDVFSDPFALEWLDPRFTAETRYCLIGAVEGRILFVAYTLVEGERIRIISARKAEPFERRRYHEDNR
ncbi:MAG: BrnT family toxin [Maricaulaceae bacterium]